MSDRDEQLRAAAEAWLAASDELSQLDERRSAIDGAASEARRKRDEIERALDCVGANVRRRAFVIGDRVVLVEHCELTSGGRANVVSEPRTE